jgi:hypothetical protein
MSSFAALAGEALDVCFATLGMRATYTPPGGAAIACSVMQDRSDQTVSGPGLAKAFSEGGVFELRKSEVAQPVSGGIIALLADDGSVISSHKIGSDPKSEDDFRLVWRCMARPFTP